MVEYIELGGKRRPILYGNAAFKMLKDRKGFGLMKFLDELSTGDPDVVSDITFCALRVGERAEKLPPSEDFKEEMDVAVWIDLYPGGVQAIMNLIVKSLPKAPAEGGEGEPGEAKASGIGTT